MTTNDGREGVFTGGHVLHEDSDVTKPVAIDPTINPN